MRGKPQDCMDVGIVAFMAWPEWARDHRAAVRAVEALAADPYFTTVEVTRIADAAARKDAAAALSASGKRALFGLQPALLGAKADLGATVPAVRQKALDLARAGLDESQDWKAAGFAVCSGIDPGPAGRAAAMSYTIASLKELCEVSRRAGAAPIVLETFDRRPDCKNLLVGPTAEAVQIADVVYPYYMSFGLLLDQAHLPLLGETPAEALGLAAPYLRHAHIGNCILRDAKHPNFGDNHPTFDADGGENGCDQLVEFIRALFQAGYLAEGRRAGLSFEVKPFGSEDPEQVVARSKETLDAAWAKA